MMKIRFISVVAVASFVTACSATPDNSPTPSTEAIASPTTSLRATNPGLTTCQLYANDPDNMEHMLSDVSVTEEPDGSHTFAFTYSGNVQQAYVAFGLATIDASRLFKVKFGNVESDTVTIAGTTSTVGTSTLTPEVQRVSVPPHAAAPFKRGWVAEMTVNGKHAGRCSSPAGFEQELLAHSGPAGSAKRMN